LLFRGLARGVFDSLIAFVCRLCWGLGYACQRRVPRWRHMVADGAQRLRAEVDLRDALRLCAGQSATALSDAAPAGPPLRATVMAIGAAESSRTLPGGSEAHGAEIVPVTLTLNHDAPVLPVGTPVSVRFDSCPPKT
jgi:hypothetical protein